MKIKSQISYSTIKNFISWPNWNSQILSYLIYLAWYSKSNSKQII